MKILTTPDGVADALLGYPTVRCARRDGHHRLRVGAFDAAEGGEDVGGAFGPFGVGV